MMGPLHTEMAFMNTVGDLLKDSGWTTIITNAHVARSGVAESLVSGHDVVRTKYSHQVTASALYKLQHQAYLEIQESEARMTFNEWCCQMEEKSPTFQFWSCPGTCPVYIPPGNLYWQFVWFKVKVLLDINQTLMVMLPSC